MFIIEKKSIEASSKGIKNKLTNAVVKTKKIVNLPKLPVKL